MTEPSPLDKELARIARLDLVKSYFRSIGSTDEQAATAAAAHAEKFVYDGTHLSFQGKPVSSPDNGVREWFTANNLDFLLPKASVADAPEVNPALLEQARNKNMTAYSQLARQHGKAVIDTLLAKEKSDAEKDKDASKNPWRSANFRTDKAAQAEAARLITALGTRAAASMAKAAGKTLDGGPLRA